MADHTYNIAKAGRNLSKGGYRITGNRKVQRTNKGGKIVRCRNVFLLHLLPQLLIGFEDKFVVSRMARKLNLQEVSSLFAVQFSERSGLVKDVKAAESILRDYETATTTRFSCFKANKRFEFLFLLNKTMA